MLALSTQSALKARTVLNHDTPCYKNLYGLDMFQPLSCLAVNSFLQKG